MEVILHADDFGFNEETVRATIECFERGSLSSATIMVNCEATQMAIEYAKKHPEFSWGVHLTYVDGLSPLTKCESLLDANGVFADSNDLRKKAMAFRLNQREIIDETVAQIEVLINAGIKVSHIDSHGHIHKFPSFLLAVKKAARICGIKRVRGVQNVFLKDGGRGLIGFLNKLFRTYIHYNHMSTDYFYMPANSSDTNWADGLLKKMDRVKGQKSIEVGVHPGSKEKWRINEFNDVNDFTAKLKRAGHRIITWNDIC